MSTRLTIDPVAQLRYLGREWALMLRPGNLVPDLLASVAVALVAVPLSLAIANASGVPPIYGLVTAVVGGVVAALFGGCRLQVSGPAAAMTFLVFEVVTKYGMKGLVAGVLIAGVLQVVSGVFRIGRFMQFIPRPVIAGFLSGIGITIFCSQLPKILGYDVSHSEEGGAVALLYETLRRLDSTRLTSLVIGLTAVGMMFGVPRISRRLPAPLIAVVSASMLPLVFDWKDVALLGALPAGFVAPRLPVIPWEVWNELVQVGLTIYFIASIESLLSAAVVDSMDKSSRIDNDQELIGQGLANIASGLFGGIPVTGVIARSATNVQAGARSRMSALTHALLILVMMLALGALVARIPIAALAGVLIAVALRMIEIHVLKTLWRGSRAEAAVYVVTAGTIVFTDLIVGVPVGLVAAFTYFVYEMSRLNLEGVSLEEPNEALALLGEQQSGSGCPAVSIMRVEGPLFFASSFHLRNLVDRLGRCKSVIFDMQGVPFLDITGAEALEESIERLKSLRIEPLLVGLMPAVKRRIQGMTQKELLALREVPMYATVQDALLHASSRLEQEDLCARCSPEGKCLGIEGALEGAMSSSRSQKSVPRVRAIVALGEEVQGGFRVEDTRDPVESAARIPVIREDSVRPSPMASWNERSRSARIDPTAYLDPFASIIGEVHVGPRVYIGPGVSVRADEGTPFHIGAESSLQDGVTLHALKDKVVMVQGRPYAIYVGRDVCLTHHALIHGPCYIGDRCFIGFKAMVYDAIVGEGCVLGLGAIVIGVSIGPNRFVGHNQLVDTQQAADALPMAGENWNSLREDVVGVNQELAAGHRDVEKVPPPV